MLPHHIPCTIKLSLFSLSFSLLISCSQFHNFSNTVLSPSLWTSASTLGNGALVSWDSPSQAQTSCTQDSVLTVQEMARLSLHGPQRPQSEGGNRSRGRSDPAPGWGDRDHPLAGRGRGWGTRRERRPQWHRVRSGTFDRQMWTSPSLHRLVRRVEPGPA